MDTSPDQSTQTRYKSRFQSVVLYIGAAVGVVALLAFFFLCLPAVGTVIGFALAINGSGETLLHSDPNRDSSIIARVVSDDCGALCDCSTRIDLTFGQSIKKGAYRVHDSCDVQIRWLDKYRFEVVPQLGDPFVLDARNYGSFP